MCKKIEDNILELLKSTIIKKNNLSKNMLKLKHDNFDALSCNVKNITKKIFWGNEKYKFLEKTVWNKEKELCVALGFNPTNNDINKIDGTNKKIITQLKKDYDGYYLLNLYPQRSNSKEKFDESDEIGKEYYDLIPNLLDIIFNNSNYKLVLFFGRTVSINELIVEKLIKFKKENRLMMTVKKGTELFYHPARVDIEIKEVKNDFYNISYQVVGI